MQLQYFKYFKILNKFKYFNSNYSFVMCLKCFCISFNIIFLIILSFSLFQSHSVILVLIVIYRFYKYFELTSIFRFSILLYLYTNI